MIENNKQPRWRLSDLGGLTYWPEGASEVQVLGYNQAHDTFNVLLHGSTFDVQFSGEEALEWVGSLAAMNESALTWDEAEFEKNTIDFRNAHEQARSLYAACQLYCQLVLDR